MAASGRTGGLLAVHAHPDDETLSTGGLLATWASLGRPVTVVTCTRGEQGEVIPAELAHLEGDAPGLAEHRERELAAALTALGVADHRYLDQLPDPAATTGVDAAAPIPVLYRDSGMVWVAGGLAGRVAELPVGAFVAAPVDEAARRLAGLIRELRPDVVVTYEPGGGYGHPDHVHTHRVTMRAVAFAANAPVGLSGEMSGATGGPSAFRVPIVLWAVEPEATMRSALAALPALPWVEALRVADPRLCLPDPSGPLPSMAVLASQADFVVDVSGVASAVVSALRAHATQVQSIATTPGGPVPIEGAAINGCFALCNDVLQPLLDREWYRAATGWRLEGDRCLSPLTPQVP